MNKLYSAPITFFFVLILAAMACTFSKPTPTPAPLPTAGQATPGQSAPVASPNPPATQTASTPAVATPLPTTALPTSKLPAGQTAYVNSNVARDVVIYKRVAYTATLGGMVGWNLDSGYRMAYTPLQGMPHVSSYSITLCEIPQVRILVGTQAGIGVYDPNSGLWEKKTLVPENSGVNQNKVTRLYCDTANKRLLIGYYGLGVLDLASGSFKRYTSNEGLATNEIADIAVVGKDIWVATGYKGLSKISDGQVTTYTKEKGLPHESVYAVAPGANGTLWIGTPGGLAKGTNNQWALLGSESQAKLSSIKRILPTSDGKFWVATAPIGTGRLCLFDPTSLSCKTETKDADNESITGLALDEKGLPVYTTSQGVTLFDGTKAKVFKHNEALASNFVDSMANDPRNGKLWVGTDNGIHLLDPANPQAPWTTFHPKTHPEMGGNWATAIAAAADGTAWFAITNGYASRYQNGTWSSYKEIRSFDALTVDAQGRAWFGDDSKGIVVLNADGSQALTLTKNQGLPSDAIYSLLAVQNVIWIGTDQGLAKYENEKVSIVLGKDDTRLPNRLIRALVLEPNGNLLIGTSMGIVRWSNNQAQTLLDFQKANLSSARLNTLAVSPKGRIWIGTDKGVVYSDDEKNWKTLTTQDQLLSNYISALHVDAYGAAWVGGGGSNFDGGGLLHMVP